MDRMVAVVGVLLLAAGCGSGLDTAPVSGTITLNGQPLANASVTFTPAATGLEAPASNGRTDASGNYTLQVTVTGDKGAVKGMHTVRIALIGEDKVGEDADVISPATQPSLPDHNFSFEVLTGANVANFNLGEGGG